MAYRNGTYVAFHAAGQSDPTASDIKYFNLLKAWHVRAESEFFFVDSHAKNSAIRDANATTLRTRLADRLRNSKNMILVLGQTTRFDSDWVPFEIEYAVDACEIPIIATYPGYQRIGDPWALRSTWPRSLATRIDSGTAHVIHVPFKQKPLSDAVTQFSHINYPRGGGVGIYDDDTYRLWGLL